MAVLLACLHPGVAAAATAGPLPPPENRCRITDDRLSELSGLVAGDSTWYAVNDGGTSVKVYSLDPDNCAVRGVRTAEIDPYDVEDLELAPDGTLWLADTGDNSMRRETVALHAVPSRPGASEAAVLYRLRYPDGPHNAEALVLGSSGVPYIITKDPLGTAGIYRPVAELDPDRAVGLERVGSLSLEPTETPGGPLPGAFGSVTVTGAAVSRDGTVVAVRTYTDAYLFHSAQGDVLEALRGQALRVPLPGQPQGEAIALSPNGTMLSASEGLQPVQAVPGAVAAAQQYARESKNSRERKSTSPQPAVADSAADEAGRDGLPMLPALVVAGVLAAGIVLVAGRLARKNR